jgi:nitrate reductase NapAB chaperone NapD
MNKNIAFIFILFVGFLTSCSQSADYTILDDETINNMPTVSTYVEKLQSDNLDYKGFKVFDTSDGKVVVISSGEANKTLKVHKIEKSSKDTGVIVLQSDTHSEQKNPYVAINLDEIVGAFYVFERVQYQGTDN